MLRGESEPEDENITPTCPIGYSLVDGACVSRETPFCPSGFHFSGGRCVENPTNFCPEGSIWDGAQCANPHKDECQQKLDSCQTTIDACAAEGEKCQLEKASCEALKTACEIDKTTYETQLGKCKVDKVDLKHELEKSQNCETDKAKLERELENLRGTQALATCKFCLEPQRWFRQLMSIGTPNTSKNVVIDGKTWKIWCTQRKFHATFFELTRANSTDWHAVSLGQANKATFKECLDFCVSTPRCKSVLFDPTGQSHNTNCHLRTEIRATGPAQYRNSGRHTASLLH